MHFQEVSSSALKSVAYSEEKETLYVKFHGSDQVWSYYPLDQSEYYMLVNAESIGSFFHKHIKTNPGITAMKE